MFIFPGEIWMFLLIFYTLYRSTLELRMLVRAGASVSSTRPDGVTAIWLAAQVYLCSCIISPPHRWILLTVIGMWIIIQFGHSTCIKTLAGLKADVNQARQNSVGFTLGCCWVLSYTGGEWWCHTSVYSIAEWFPLMHRIAGCAWCQSDASWRERDHCPAPGL